jgi:AhpD family alkylhydroperoxidase
LTTKKIDAALFCSVVSKIIPLASRPQRQFSQEEEMTAEYRLSLPLQSLETADSDAKPVLEKALAQVGFLPNMYSGMVNLPGVLDTYLTGYAAFRKGTAFTAQEQEVILLTISAENACTYCVAAHSVIADQMSKVPIEVTDAIRNGTTIPDPKLAALSKFTELMVVGRGLPTKAEVEEFLRAGYTEHHILGIVLAIAVKTLSNFSNHLFHTPLDERFAGRVWSTEMHRAAAE